MIELFRNLREHYISKDGTDSVNKLVPMSSINELELISKQDLTRCFQELLSFDDNSLDFTNVGSKVTKEKNCKIGWRCGYTCLPTTKKNCSRAINGQASVFVGFLNQNSPPSQTTQSLNSQSGTTNVTKEQIEESLTYDKELEVSTNQGNVKLKYNKGQLEITDSNGKIQKIKMTRDQLAKYSDSLLDPNLAKGFGISNFRIN